MTVCLGVPGRVVSLHTGSDLADVDVAGVVRTVNVGLLEERPAPGEHILIHSGFALERMTEAEARDALAVFGDEGGLDVPGG